MRVWLVKTGEPLPCDGKNVRLMRMGLLAEALQKRGHEVIWWASTFDHRHKTFRFNNDRTIEIGNSYTLKLIHSIGYNTNISPKRMLEHYLVGRKFIKLAIKEEVPDIILCSFPTIDLSLYSVKYALAKKVPIVLDVRDLWPDSFIDFVPSILLPVAKVAFRFLDLKTKYTFKNATSITGNSIEMVGWGLKKAGRVKGEMDIDFPFGYSANIPDKNDLDNADKFWKNLGIDDDKYSFIACFFGAFGRRSKVDTIIKAARIIQTKSIPIFFVICGGGELADAYKKMSISLNNIKIVDWIDTPKIYKLMQMSSVGLAPYESSSDFVVNLPNKPMEYMSAGLPIISSLSGYLENILKEFDCGITYCNDRADELADILICLYNNPNRLAVMSKNSIRLFRSQFDAKIVYKKFSEYLESVASKKAINCNLSSFNYLQGRDC